MKFASLVIAVAAVSANEIKQCFVGSNPTTRGMTTDNHSYWLTIRSQQWKKQDETWYYCDENMNYGKHCVQENETRTRKFCKCYSKVGNSVLNCGPAYANYYHSGPGAQQQGCKCENVAWA